MGSVIIDDRNPAYDAEEYVFEGSAYQLFDNFDGPSWVEVNAVAHKLRKAYKFAPRREFLIIHSTDERGYGGHNGIAIPPLAGLPMVLHELAHVAAKTLSDDEEHGEVWACWYLQFVHDIINSGMADHLRDAFLKFGVLQ